jgi:hypothetical protein
MGTIADTSSREITHRLPRCQLRLVGAKFTIGPRWGLGCGERTPSTKSP